MTIIPNTSAADERLRAVYGLRPRVLHQLPPTPMSSPVPGFALAQPHRPGREVGLGGPSSKCKGRLSDTRPVGAPTGGGAEPPKVGGTFPRAGASGGVRSVRALGVTLVSHGLNPSLLLGNRLPEGTQAGPWATATPDPTPLVMRGACPRPLPPPHPSPREAEELGRVLPGEHLPLITTPGQGAAWVGGCHTQVSWCLKPHL